MKVTFDLTPQIRKQAEERARAKDQSLNAYLVDAVAKAVKREEQPKNIQQDKASSTDSEK